MSSILKAGSTITINNKVYFIKELIGHGKGGYSFLALLDDVPVVIKQIHHEPCDYYKFGNKIEAEIHDYQTLIQTGIKMPKMLDVDKNQEIIVKEYIEGINAFELIKQGLLNDEILMEIRKIQDICKGQNINIDYYPTNFIVTEEGLYYVDYECNAYDQTWDFDNWGIKYWNKKPEKFETERLIMRKFQIDDAELMFKNWANDPEVTKYVTWSPHGNVEVTRELISMWVKQDSEPYFYQYVIVDKESNEPIGSLGVAHFSDGKPELGYCLSKKFWNQGLMTEACLAFIGILFNMGFDEMTIRAVKENIGSNRVIEKCGFVFVNETKEIVSKNGQNNDETILNYSLKRKSK